MKEFVENEPDNEANDDMAHEQHVSVYPVKEILTDMFYTLKVYLVRKPLMQGTGAWHLFIILPCDIIR